MPQFPYGHVLEPKYRNRQRSVLVDSYQVNPPSNVRSPTTLYQGGLDGLLVSFGHRRDRKGFYREGGPFWCVHIERTFSEPVLFRYRRTGVDYESLVTIWHPELPFGQLANLLPSLSGWDDVAGSLMADYATGYARAKPGQSIAGLGQFLGELQDVPKIPLQAGLKAGISRAWKDWRYSSVWKRGLRLGQIPLAMAQDLTRFRALGSEYLNAVFGWEPFLRDLAQLYDVSKALEKAVTRLTRENAKWIRRRATIRNDRESSREDAESVYPFYWTQDAPTGTFTGPDNWSRVTVTSTTTRRTWFVGSFRYYIRDPGSWQWRTKAKLALLGAMPSPELVWELTPFSWLADWFTNIGDCFSNSSYNPAENLVTRYSYTMEEKVTTTEAQTQVFCLPYDPTPSRFSSRNDAFRRTLYYKQSVTSKSRLGGGNPYVMMAKSWTDLNPRQLAILAALGISRSAVQ